MFGKGFTLFKVAGFEIKIDTSWVFLVALITWSLGAGLFPFYYPHLASQTYWWMGAFGALGLFVSVLCHELCHSLVARKYGLVVKSITLFIFGGVSESAGEPRSPKVEFLMAAAGPALSVLLGLAFYGIYGFGKSQNWPIPVNGVLSYLGSINLILAAFNLVPGFPLDGGRMLRSALWKAKGDLKWATRIASDTGVVFGWVLIALGIFSFFRDNFIGGIWWFLIGLFLKSAARMSYQQLLIQESLKGETIRRFITQNPISVSPSLTLDRFVEDYVYRHHFKMFPVIQDSKLLGSVGAESLKTIPRDDWAKHTIQEIVKPCSLENAVVPDTDVRKAILTMNQSGNSRLLVREGQRLIGVVTLKDLLEFLALKLELEGEEAKPRQRHLKVAS